jgi:hypothetical protein
MADLTTNIVAPSLVATTPSYNAVSAADFFTAQPGSKYRIHYKNGATPGTGLLKVTDPTSVAPAGSSPAGGWSDVPVVTNMAATTEKSVIVNSDRFRDANGRINLANAGTITTITVAIEGPL